MPRHAIDPVTLSKADMAFASESARLFSASIRPTDGAIHVRIEEPDAPNQAIAVPVAAFALFVSMLDSMAKGKAVHVVEHDAEVTTGEMAKLLNVSAPYAAKMLDEGTIPSRRVGTHRRARLADVLAYRDGQYKARKAVLDHMAEIDQELGLE